VIAGADLETRLAFRRTIGDLDVGDDRSGRAASEGIDHLGHGDRFSFYFGFDGAV
jgi:hypothetical protein